MEALIQEMQRGPPSSPPKGCWVPEALVVLAGEPWMRSLFSPALGEGEGGRGASVRWGGSQVVAIFLMSFTSSPREWFSYCVKAHIHGIFNVYSEVRETETLEFGAEKGLLQGPVRRRVLMPPTPNKNPNSLKAFRKVFFF